jgi:uncharacterized spore protein YtfJ
MKKENRVSVSGNINERSHPVTALITKLAGNTSRTVYGEAIVSDDATIIPTATLRWVGGGGGSNEEGEGFGLGGFVSASPVGYIVIKKGSATFKYIVDINVLVPTILALGLIVFFLMKILIQSSRVST